MAAEADYRCHDRGSYNHCRDHHAGDPAGIHRGGALVIDAHQTDYRPIAGGDAKSGSSGLYIDGQVIETQIQIIRSRGIIAQVINRLQLDQTPEFNERLRPQSLSERMWAWGLRRLHSMLAVVHLDAYLTFVPHADTVAGDEPLQMAQTRIVEAVREKLDVGEEGLSSVIRIAFTSQSPETAALAANSVAEFYITDRLAAKAKIAQNANDWVNERVAELRQEVQQAENAVQKYIEQQGLIKTKEGSPTAQEIAQLSAELARARADRAVAEARLRQLTMLLNSPKGLESTSEVIGSPLIIHLRQQEAQLQNKLAELSETYGELSPKMLDVKAAIADIKNKIRGEAERISEGIRNDVAVGRAREKSIGDRLDESKKGAGAARDRGEAAAAAARGRGELELVRSIFDAIEADRRSNTEVRRSRACRRDDA